MSEKKYPLATILLLSFLLMAANVLFYTVWGVVAYVIRDCVMFQITFFPCLQNPLIYLSGVFIVAIPLVPSFIVFDVA